MKVLIVGGGIAGPALAHWLSRSGANITLIERSPSMRTGGQQLDIRGQGVPLLSNMGIEAAVRAKAIPETGTQFIDLDGNTKAFFPIATGENQRQSFTTEFEIRRGHLVQILYDLTKNKSNVRHVFNTSIESFTQDEESDPNGKVHVNFEDGRKEDYDLVVGADGSGSKVRKMMLGPGAPDPRHWIGGYFGIFTVPSEPQDSNRWTFCHLPGAEVSRILATRKDCPEFTRIYMMVRGKHAAIEDALRSRNLTIQKKAWADLYQDGGWECSRFVDALRHTPEADDLYSTPLEEVRLPLGSWSKGRVVLIGDAAHSQTVNGFGTTAALLGSYVLAGEIAKVHAKDKASASAAVVQGAKNYEEEFRQVSTATQGRVEWFLTLAMPRTSLAIWCLHKFAGLAAYWKFDQNGSLNYVNSWQIPDYPELESNYKN